MNLHDARSGGAVASTPPALSPPQLRFSELGRLGHTSWLRHLAGFGIIVGFWIVLGGAASLAAMMALSSLGGGPLAGYLLVNVPFPFLLAGVLVTVRYVHRRPLRTLITPRARVDLRRIAVSFGLFFALGVATMAVEMLLSPDRFSLTFDPARWILTLPVIVVVTSLQTTAEEFFFRGYVLQTVGLFTRRAWILVLLNSIVFAGPHLLNPEMSSGAVLIGALYVLLGAFFTILAVRDNRLELALGAHAANNLIAALLVNHPNSSLPTQAIWQVSALDPTFIVVSFLVSASIFTLILTRRRPS